MKNNTPTNKKDTTNTLFFGVNNRGEIVQFDKKCQNITGYPRDEVLNQKIWDYLIPEAHISKWQHIIDKVMHSEPIENLKLPWKTSNGNEILVTWNSFPLDNKDTTHQTYCFIGQPQPPQTPDHQRETPLQSDNQEQLSTYAEQTQKESHQSYCIEKQKSEPQQLNNKTQQNQQFFKDRPKSPNIPEKKYAELEHRLIELEKKDQSLEQKNKQLEKTINNLTNKQSIHKQDNQSDLTKSKNKTFTLSSKLKTLFQHHNKKNYIAEELEWIELKTHELKTKEQQLITKENQIDKKIIELSQWKEKLIELESEITNRYESLQQLEKQHTQQNQKTPIQKFTQELLEEYTQSVAVLQRGLFKAINTSLTDIFGYSHEELANKSFYDLIAPEGLADIEQFHLDRLKGKKPSKYSTVFLNKEKEKVEVEIQFDPIIFSEQKADLAFIVPIKVEPIEPVEEENSIIPEETQDEPINPEEEKPAENSIESASIDEQEEHKIKNNDNELESKNDNLVKKIEE